MVNLTIDGQKVSVPQGTTIMQAAATVGIEIPRLCYLKGINEISACKVCVVEIQGQNRVVTACTTPVQEGLVVYTNSPKARSIRRTNVELILSQHDCMCATCVRSGNCSLQTLANDLGIYDIPYERDVVDTPWNQEFPLIRDSKKCIKCMRCVQICDKVQKLHIWDVQNTGSRTTVDVAGNVSIEDSDCSLCGQCITHCPVGALKERNDVPKIYDVLADPNKVTVVQVAPAVRTAWAEAFNLPPEMATEGRMVAALKKIGFDYVFDTCYAADVTIMEEASELLEHLQNPQDHSWPMFTSCCPGWIQHVEHRHPHLMPQVSTCGSPMAMFGSLIRKQFAGENVYSVAIMPCTGKKFEAARPELEKDGERLIDLVITTSELCDMIEEAGIDFAHLPDEEPDAPLGDYTGAGVIFGVTGGVTEAVIRRVLDDASPNTLQTIAECGVRGLEGIKAFTVTAGDLTIRIAVANGLANADKLIAKVESGEEQFDFIEVMACPNGCIGGGGQPPACNKRKAERAEAIFKADEACALRIPQQNPDLGYVYDTLLQGRAHELLHIHYPAHGQHS